MRNAAHNSEVKPWNASKVEKRQLMLDLSAEQELHSCLLISYMSTSDVLSSYKSTTVTLGPVRRGGRFQAHQACLDIREIHRAQTGRFPTASFVIFKICSN
jgi:hypothetical protein